MSNLARTFDDFRRDYLALKRRMPHVMGTIAVRHVHQNFLHEGQKINGVYHSWPRRRGNADAARRLLTKSGGLQASVHYRVTPRGVQIKTGKKYAKIHQTGGEIRITRKMRRFFWAMFMQTSDPKWKSMALTQRRSINIPERPFFPPDNSRDLGEEIDREIIVMIQRLVRRY